MGGKKKDSIDLLAKISHEACVRLRTLATVIRGGTEHTLHLVTDELRWLISLRQRYKRLLSEVGPELLLAVPASRVELCGFRSDDAHSVVFLVVRKVLREVAKRINGGSVGFEETPKLTNLHARDIELIEKGLSFLDPIELDMILLRLGREHALVRSHDGKNRGRSQRPSKKPAVMRPQSQSGGGPMEQPALATSANSHATFAPQTELDDAAYPLPVRSENRKEKVMPSLGPEKRKPLPSITPRLQKTMFVEEVPVRVVDDRGVVVYQTQKVEVPLGQLSPYTALCIGIQNAVSAMAALIEESDEETTEWAQKYSDGYLNVIEEGIIALRDHWSDFAEDFVGLYLTPPAVIGGLSGTSYHEIGRKFVEGVYLGIRILAEQTNGVSSSQMADRQALIRNWSAVQQFLHERAPRLDANHLIDLIRDEEIRAKRARKAAEPADPDIRAESRQRTDPVALEPRTPPRKSENEPKSWNPTKATCKIIALMNEGLDNSAIMERTVGTPLERVATAENLRTIRSRARKHGLLNEKALQT